MLSVIAFSELSLLPSYRPHPNECSGSDLDGDIYFVTWDPVLVPPREVPPMEYTPAPTETLDHDVTIEVVLNIFIISCSIWLIIADSFCNFIISLKKGNRDWNGKEQLLHDFQFIEMVKPQYFATIKLKHTHIVNFSWLYSHQFRYINTYKLAYHQQQTDWGCCQSISL